jgi:hypothetical protein
MATKTANRLPVTPNGDASTEVVAPQVQTPTVVVERISPQLLELEIVGITPLLVCAWSEKAKRMILDKQMKKAKRGKDAKDPQADYLASRYISTEGWDGVPAGGLKGCVVNACRAVDGLPMTLAKRMLFVRAQGYTKDNMGLVRIYGEHQMHEGMVRIDQGTADIRFRAIYPTWSMKLEIEFLSSIISAEQVANLVELSGFIEGLCEHRPGAPKSCTGNNGRFQIKRPEGVK